MSGISLDHQQEIRQRWLIVKHYLRLARDRQKGLAPHYLAKTVGELALPFATKGPIDLKTRSLNILAANLSSAALRLAIIEERLDGYNLSRVLQDYRRERDRGYDRDGFKQLFLARKAEWLHILMRNNLVPAEPGREEERYGALDAVGAMTIQELYDALTTIQARLDQELRDVHQILP